ncbi:phosphate ABC transporter, permease protein PstA [Campylobacter sputorum subsp. bubulus]|uniref:Phosphate transport system permease protein PstA n=1 Tax=Campylobacter sputorum subsp. sputorum TaxID=32024 RepID=A0A381DK39_9BACT|nr:phosphate ABC transporter permease PstA [Campylobacter sputorum]ASM35912.1 phosphate ABC transporter, permease protein [Campylobacter sputorum aubsp. sputorum RM3237]ASM37596.1 phosphate ABC transporter, permease protein [Campylobacter sputorum bv. faecalis CCUG 20703]KAB0582353.1 phosphate ABC transporter permease PstA [Campylobacter sputorum subsp. sputorum]QEL06102.1 phosphate ABC transporter, permease protein [Campylobacter sputorum subsp. sputorum]SUX09216.1 phosphate ABC transporter, 
MSKDKFLKTRLKATKKRVFINALVSSFSIFFAIVGLLFLFWIIVTLAVKGIDGFSASMFVTDTIEGGIRNALVGHIILIGIASIIGIPIGLLAGTYLSEYGGPNDKKSNFVRNMSDIMMSTPSIVIGAFAYAILVSPMSSYSGLAGSIALCIMMVPVVLKTTDDMLTLVPQTLREAAIAIGAPKYKVIVDIIFRAAKNGLVTGIILAIARVAGETAPLLFTSFHSDFFVLNPLEPMPSLTNTIYEFTQYPDDYQNAVAWATAFLLAVFVLGINIVCRFLIKQKKR